MEPATRILSHQSTKSYLEREMIVSLDDNGPMIGPNLEMMDTHREEDDDYHNENNYEQSPSTKNDIEVDGKRRFLCWKGRSKKPADYSDPKKFPKIKKNTILLLVAIGGAISPVSTTIYYPALIDMQRDFNTTDTIMNASLSIFTFFTAFFPLVWATFGDLFGRRRIYIISFFITCVGSTCCALSVNANMFIAFRAISAIGSSSAMSMGAGTISDIFEPHERGRAFAYYTCGPLLGPAIGPIIGGYLNKGLGWRSNFWFLAIFCFLTWLGIVFFLPETWRATLPPPEDCVAVPDNADKVEKPSHHGSPTSSTSSTINEEVTDIDDLPPKEASTTESKKSQRTAVQVSKRNNTRFVNPIGALKLLLYPNIALAVTFVGVLFFVLYLNSTNFTRTYTLQYGFDSGIVGLCYLPSAAGSMIGGIAGGRMSDKIYNKRVAKARAAEQEIYPEMRLGGPLFYSSILLQLLSFIAYGWCVEKNVHFAYGLVCQFFIGLALMLPNVTLSAYMVDCFRKKGASVTACNNFARYIMAGVGSLIASDILRALGNGILFTLCGCFLLVASLNLVLIRLYTKKWAMLRSRDAE